MSDREFGKRAGNERPRRNDNRGERSAGTGIGRGGKDNRQSAPSGRAERTFGGAETRPEWQNRVARPFNPDKPKSPPIPDEITEKDLELGLRVQLKTLTPENAEKVARHLAMVGLLIDQDPELAHRHALAAAERAGRIAMVREVVGVTAYTVGDFALGLRELLTHRRISGSNDQIPIIVDCERGLGRPDRALELGRSVNRSELPVGVRVNLAIALSGARLDRSENELALVELQIPELDPARVFDFSPPLFRAYADTLEILGRADEAKRWFDLAERAEHALAGNPGPEDEVFEVLEEIEIPVLSERKPWEPRGDADRGRTGASGPRSDGERHPRANNRDEERQPRRFGRDEDRQPRSFGGPRSSGSGRPQGDSRGKGNFGGGRPGGARGR